MLHHIAHIVPYGGDDEREYVTALFAYLFCHIWDEMSCPTEQYSLN